MAENIGGELNWQMNDRTVEFKSTNAEIFSSQEMQRS